MLFLTITPEFDDLDENLTGNVVNSKEKTVIYLWILLSKWLLTHFLSIKSINKVEKFQNIVSTATTTKSDNKSPIVYDINLPNAPVNETHPFNVGNKRQNSKTK